MSDLDRLLIEPLADCQPEIGRLLWQLNDVRQRVLKWVAKINPEQLDWNSPDHTLNSIGSLLYHIVAVELDWLYTEVLQQEWTSEVQVLFPFEMRDANGRLTEVRGVSLDDHLARLNTVRGWVLNAFLPMSLEEFRRPRQMPNYHVTPEWVIYHLLQHESEHFGEMQTVYTLATLAAHDI